MGIYKITNNINGKFYIGRAKNIEKRWRAHKTNCFDPKAIDYYKCLYKAIREYGLENFTFEVIEECSEEELTEKEGYYISFYNANNPEIGYNRTNGYEYPQYGLAGEEHPNHKLTEQEVYYIRECYNNHRNKDEVYEEFKYKINFTGFHKIWNGNTWPKVHMDVYTEENKQYYAFQRNSHPGSSNPKAKLNEEMVKQIRIRKKSGEKMKEVYEDYKYTGITESSFKAVWSYRNWKNIIV